VDFDGSENFHLFVHDLAQNTCTDLTSDIDFALQPNLAWSPGGDEIAFLADQAGCFDVYAMPASGGAARPVLQIGRPAWDVRWSPDGGCLAVTVEAQGQDYNIYLVPSGGGEPFALADENGPLNAHQPAWSPDGRRLAFHSDSGGWHEIYVFDLEAKKPSVIASALCEAIPSNESGDCFVAKTAPCNDTQADRTSPAWSPDGRRIAYIQHSGAASQVVVQRFGEPPVAYQVARGVHETPRFTPDGQVLLFTFSNPGHPNDLWKLSLADGAVQQLTDSLPGDPGGAAFVTPEEITYPGLDGVSVPALLYRPPDTRLPAPAVVVVHGGPNWHYQVDWNPFIAHLASRGWVVLAPNYRGSTGYGRSWQMANHYDLGGCDTRDVAGGAIYLAQAGLADPNRIAITGRSHGGYLTLTCLTQYPQLWAAGSAVAPFFNWFTSHAAARPDLQHWNIENMGDPLKNETLWRERSPYYYLERLRAALQIIGGAADPRCPAVDLIQAHERLLALDKQVDFVLYPDEGHVFIKIDNILSAEMRRFAFLARALA
jgi:dipeptidyl aminopeptidase/acylaminoacyl peptidase